MELSLENIEASRDRLIGIVRDNSSDIFVTFMFRHDYFKSNKVKIQSFTLNGDDVNEWYTIHYEKIGRSRIISTIEGYPETATLYFKICGRKFIIITKFEIYEFDSEMTNSKILYRENLNKKIPLDKRIKEG